jgi:hypothetical protein
VLLAPTALDPKAVLTRLLTTDQPAERPIAASPPGTAVGKDYRLAFFELVLDVDRRDASSQTN